MDNVNLTSADFSAVFASASTFPVGFKLENFAEGDAISVNGINSADMVKGVDGGAGYWYLPSIKELTLNLMPGESAKKLCLLAGAMEMKKKPDLVHLVVTIPSMGVVVTFTDGVLVSYPPMPQLQQRLSNMSFGFKFKECVVVPI